MTAYGTLDLKAMDHQPRIAFVLPGGGARAAYQLGVLKYIFENWHNLERFFDFALLTPFIMYD